MSMNVGDKVIISIEGKITEIIQDELGIKYWIKDCEGNMNLVRNPPIIKSALMEFISDN